MFRGILTRLAPLLAVAGAACAVPAPEPPRAEFLVATPDSTFWVTTGRGGVRVRAVPMTIARVGGRFREVYVADVDRSFSDAVYTGERVYMRDLETNDSTLIYDDTAVVVMAERHARKHPNALPLNPDDDTPTEPDETVTGETDVLDVRGPILLIEHRSAFDAPNGEQHDTVRTAIDLRTGRAAAIATITHDKDALADTSEVRVLPTEWRRAGYSLLARGDSEANIVSFTMRDAASRSWPLVTVGPHARIFWLDEPNIDEASRKALSRAFNAAAAYDESAKFASFPRRRPIHTIHSA